MDSDERPKAHREWAERFMRKWEELRKQQEANGKRIQSLLEISERHRPPDRD